MLASAVENFEFCTLASAVWNLEREWFAWDPRRVLPWKFFIMSTSAWSSDCLRSNSWILSDSRASRAWRSFSSSSLTAACIS